MAERFLPLATQCSTFSFTPVLVFPYIMKRQLIFSMIFVMLIVFSNVVAGTENCAIAQQLPLPQALPVFGPSWDENVSPGSSLEIKDGEISFDASTHTHAHVQRAATTDLITLSGKLSQWGAIYLVWGPDSWCGVGQVSPTPFGRIYSTVSANGKADEAIHRGINFGIPRWLRIRLGKNYVRFDYSSDGKYWAALRTIERPEGFSGAPKLIAAGKYYEADDKPFHADTLSVHAATSKDDHLKGHILELRAEATPQEDLRLSKTDLKALHKPKVEPVMALLNKDDEDPTFEKILKYYPPMKSPREVVGVAAHPLDIGVDHLGRMDVGSSGVPTAWFEVGDPAVALGREDVPFKRRLKNGYLPVDTLTTTLNGVEYGLTIFGWSDGFSVTKPLFAYAQLTARSLGGRLPLQVALVAPGNKRHTWRMTKESPTLARICVKLEYPKPDTTTEVTSSQFNAKLNETTSVWEHKLAQVARFDVPDTRVMEAYRAWFTYSMLNADTVNGYIEPHDGAGFYEEMFGNSVSLHAMMLDNYGLHDYAAQILETQIHFQKANGLYTQACGLTDPGAFLVGLVEHYRITGDRRWLQHVSPNIIKQVEWLLYERQVAPKDGVVRGLIKFRPYNDYPDPAFNYLGDAWCALGMRDAAEAMKILGLPQAEKYAEEAERYRKDILDSMMSAAFQDKGQTLLPIEPATRRLLKGEQYQGGGYYGLTASSLLATGFLSPDDKPTTWIVDAIEKRGGLIAGLSEFEGGIDHAYTYGYLLTEFKRGEVRKTLLGFWSMLAFGMTRDTYSPVEVTMIETGENHATLPHLYSCTEQLQLLRTLLLREDNDVLQIGEGIPRAWLEGGKHVAVNSAPTEFGELSYRIDAEADGSMRVVITPSFRHAPREIRLHLRNPGHKVIASVRTASVAQLAHSGDVIVLKNVNGPISLRVKFAGRRGSKIYSN